jgi:hypothetical protein
MTMPGRAVAGTAALGCWAAGCGGGSADYANQPRPATPINVTAAIRDDGISISPRTFGAGPIVMVVSNQTRRRHTVTLETQELGGSEPGLTETTRPVGPGGTARLQADLRSGTYEIGTRARSVAPVALEVGAPRKSAQDELLRP